MTRLSRFATLTRRYPNRITIEDGNRVRCRDITGTSDVPTSLALKEAVANQVEEAGERLEERLERRDERMTEHTEEDAGVTGESDSTAADWMQRGTEMSERVGENVSMDDIEFEEITGESEVVVEPYPRAHLCDCGHFEFFPPARVADENARSRFTCTDCGAVGEFELFPYVFVCPRCGHLEQPAPDGVHIEHDYEGIQPCPDCETGHVDLVGDPNDVGNVRFESHDCADPDIHGPWELAGDCPECDFPGTTIGDEDASKLMPGSVDSNLTRACLLSDLTRGGVGRFDEFKRKADAGEGDQLDWNLEEELSGPSRRTYRELGARSVFSLNDTESSNVAYGYTPAKSRRNSPIDDSDKLIRPFEPVEEENEARAFVVKETGRTVFVQFDPDRLLDIVPETDEETTLADIANQELAVIEGAAPGPFDDYTLALVPALHSLQHAMFETAREMAGLEQFLGSKMFIESGAVALIERENVGMGGLTQLIIEKDGSVFLDFLERTKERLATCDRDCDSACPACNYVEDAHCHPFLSREVEEYIPANALLDRERAFQVMDGA